MSSKRRQCRNHPDVFCYICGEYMLAKYRFNVRDFTKRAYKDSFGRKLGDLGRVRNIDGNPIIDIVILYFFYIEYRISFTFFSVYRKWLPLLFLLKKSIFFTFKNYGDSILFKGFCIFFVLLFSYFLSLHN